MTYFIGLMSGTSLDGMDAVLVNFSKECLTIKNKFSVPYRSCDKKLLLALCHGTDDEIAKLADADKRVAEYAIFAVKGLIEDSNLSALSVEAIGFHGQTVRHLPSKGFTLQIGDPNLLAEKSGIKVVADLRRRDLSAGGQGAPLIPAFHRAVFASPKCNRVIVNIGGMANLTLLPSADKPVIGFDTGPGNCLMDWWYQQQHKEKDYDVNGAWAASGHCCDRLLEQVLNDPYFHQAYPKSTGREYFNDSWIKSYIDSDKLAGEDLQATLCELTAKTIAMAVRQTGLSTGEIYICGGGAFNSHLLSRLSRNLSQFKIESTARLGIDPSWVEAAGFAWLARQCILKKPGNLPKVTGAIGERILGAIYQ